MGGLRRRRSAEEKRQTLVDQVVEFYLTSGDFNGMPLSKVAQEPMAGLLASVEQLIRDQKVEVLTERNNLNPHIKRFGVPEVETQVRSLRLADNHHHACLYPHPSVLDAVVDRGSYEGRPYTLELALGAAQLAVRAFDLVVLEAYRNDPRYMYRCDDVHGFISISDDYYRDSDVPDRDKILLETFGFAYNDNFDRAVASFVDYLSQLSPEHQQIWRAKQLGEEYRIHPDFFKTQLLGEWTDHIPLFTAFQMELQLVNGMAKAMGREELFRTTKLPTKFGFLVRPTSREFNDFALELDKLISDNINRSFFGDDVPLEVEEERKDGKVVVTQRGTLQLLDAWSRKKFRPKDWTPLDEAMATFKKVRRLRQSPAHRVQDDRFEQKYFHEQRRLMIDAYTGVRTLRLMLASHPRAKRVEVPEDLYEGRIRTF